ncbi:hypothetical protein ACOCJ4_10725 [Knoellia sp. CPCC 206435]|uniref:hypothetical protein n=1 Tax=Knoellia terrae TaxID=3404797 RepID=UPI003B438694
MTAPGEDSATSHGLEVELVDEVRRRLVGRASDGRPWKVKVYRPRLVNRRVHSEVLPRGQEPEARMHGLLEQFTS